MKLTKRLTALSLAAALTLGLAACGGQKDPNPTVSGEPGGVTPSAEGTTYRQLYSSEVETMNYLTTTTFENLRIPANVVDTLIEYDSYGVVQPSLAEKWESNEDSSEWTFHIRQGVKWVDKTGAEVAEVKAQDWVDAAYYILDANNDSGSEYNWDVAQVTNAHNYYEYTAYLLALETATDGVDENGNPAKLDEDGEVIKEVAPVAKEDIGVKATDDYTLVFTLDAPCPYFLSMLCWSAFMPVNGEFLEAHKDTFGIDNDNLLYCGAYILSDFQPQVQQVLTKNQSYWDKDNIFIDTIQRTYNAEASTLGTTMFLQGEVDEAEISANLLSSLMSSYSDQIHSSRPNPSYSYWYLFNFDPNFDAQYEPENWKLAVNNENFRLSIMHGLDRVNALQVYNPEDPESELSNTITPLSFASASKDYANYAGLAKYTDGDTFDSAKALEYKDKAMAELSAAGATFPVKVYVRYNPSTTNWADECQLLEQQLEGLLGADYIDVIVEAGPDTGFLGAVRRTGNYGLMKCNWGADFADASAFIVDPFKVGSSYSFIFKSEDPQTKAYYQEYLDLVATALKITNDEEARYETFAQAESILLDHGFAIPMHTSSKSYSFSLLNPLEGPYAAFGFATYRFKGQHLLEKSMGMEEFHAAYEQWLTERDAAVAAAK